MAKDEVPADEVMDVPSNQDWLTRQEDWLRTRHWDLYTPDGRPVQTLADLQLVIGDKKADLRAFVKLPAAEAAPKKLLREIEAALK